MGRGPPVCILALKQVSFLDTIVGMERGKKKSPPAEWEIWPIIIVTQFTSVIKTVYLKSDLLKMRHPGEPLGFRALEKHFTHEGNAVLIQ